MSLDFSLTYSFRPHNGPGVEAAPSENKYQEYFMGVKAPGAWGWQPHHHDLLNVMEIWEPKPHGPLWATPGLLRESFTLWLFKDRYPNLWKRADVCAGFSEVRLWTSFGTGKTTLIQRSRLTDEKISYMTFPRDTICVTHGVVCWTFYIAFLLRVIPTLILNVLCTVFFYRLSILNIPFRILYSNISSALDKDNKEEFSLYYI